MPIQCQYENNQIPDHGSGCRDFSREVPLRVLRVPAALVLNNASDQITILMTPEQLARFEKME
jgi:hypothetical protein